MDTTVNRATGGTHAGNQFDAVFADKEDNSTIDASAFLNLMVTQMQNQDFTNPMDNSDTINQMAQFSNMQSMQEIALQSKTSYAISLVGKNVTASRFTVSGDLDTTTGVVEKVSLVDNEYVLYVGDKTYTIDQIMTIGTVESGQVKPQNYDLSVTDITSSAAKLKWEVPTEDTIKAKDLKYTVYYSQEEGFDTLEAVEKGTMAGSKNQKNVTETDLSSLESGTTYYVNVVVTDPEGRKSVYKPKSFITLL